MDPASVGPDVVLMDPASVGPDVVVLMDPAQEALGPGVRVSMRAVEPDVWVSNRRQAVEPGVGVE